MWEATVQVELERPVHVVPEKAWALTGTTAALSAMPARFAFAVPAAVAGTDRLCCLITGGKTMTCAMLDVREEAPGQLICWQTRSTQPAGKQAFTLSVLPHPHGSVIRAAVSHRVLRSSRIRWHAYWRSQVSAWIDRLGAVAEGRVPWPQAAMPADMQRGCSSQPPLKNPECVSVTVLIEAPAAAVWQAVWAPETTHLISPERVACAGHVPGTPERAVGEMQYTVLRHPGGCFTAAVDVVRELDEERSAVTQSVGPPDAEILHLITPFPEGTRLELTCRWPARAHRKGDKNMTAGAAMSLQATAEGYKVIERSAGPHMNQ